jgi:hypothetical protein
MDKKIAVQCECEGTGFIGVQDSGGDGVVQVECGAHNPAYQDVPSVDELLARLGKVTGLSAAI